MQIGFVQMRSRTILTCFRKKIWFTGREVKLLGTAGSFRIQDPAAESLLGQLTLEDLLLDRARRHLKENNYVSGWCKYT